MNNNFNNPNNQGMQNGGVNNYNGQFGGNVPPQPQQPMMTQPMPGQVPMGQPQMGQPMPGQVSPQQPMMTQQMPQPTMQQPVNSPVNPQMTAPGNTNTNTQKSSKAPVIIIIVVILAIAAGGIVLALSGNNDDKKDSKPNNETNNSAEVNDSSNDNTNNQTNNSSDNTPNNNNSDDPAPLNSFANIGGNVEMKVNHTYVEDTFFFVTRVTFKNNGTTDVTLNAPGFDATEFVYFGAYFVPKSVGIANATEKDLMNESCYLRKIVRSDGIETTITSGDTENTLLHAGETLDAMVNCSITRVEGNASGVEPVMFYTTHYPNSNERVETTFNIKNSLQQ